MSKAFFITGTDTEVGKTVVSAALLHAANARGLTTMALKPVAAGCGQTPDGLRNSDAVMLQEVMNTELAYEQVNPVALEAAIAPHVAAQQAGYRMTIDRLAGYCRGTLMKRVDFTVVEGAGGWRVPVNHRETLADLPKALSLPVVMVVGIRLGCLNHALLTAEAIIRDGLSLAGWVANHIAPTMSAAEESVATLERWLPAPCLGYIPFLHKPQAIDIQTDLDIGKLLV
ncbi:dethiobiotin synthase [Candidatus Endobugula sertula]|uniref:ATP-dependent dethiobiotin synthetase BioD n=1 Tax=Candidatus Endobugula sertula TaxID=62101 RepID=A0A1D2QRR7_9GAMM|nr:dethiobiotin synthase [Candidatus Endobugula sertula]